MIDALYVRKTYIEGNHDVAVRARVANPGGRRGSGNAQWQWELGLRVGLAVRTRLAQLGQRGRLGGVALRGRYLGGQPGHHRLEIVVQVVRLDLIKELVSRLLVLHEFHDLLVHSWQDLVRVIVHDRILACARAWTGRG